MITNWRYSLALVAFGLVLPINHAFADLSLTLIPANGVISGAPGSTIGWGFTITNTSTTDWLEVTSSSFTPATLLGTYTDFTPFNFIVVGPAPESASVTQNFDPVALTGLGSFTISPSAPDGSSAIGQLSITYSLFSADPNDPNFDPDTSTVVADGFLCSASSGPLVPCGTAQVNVNAAVPEPRRLMLLTVLAGFVALGLSRRRREPGEGF